MQDYWQRQTKQKPLFPDMLWSRPENRQFAGKLLIVGGNAHGFASPAEAYAEAGRAGIGVARVLLPDVLYKTLGKAFEAGEFAPSTPSGSFSQKALMEMLSLAQWADGVLLDGDLGRNSETAILLEKFITKYSGQLTLCSDAADYFINPQTTILDRADTLLVLNFPQLQKLAGHAHFTTAFTSTMDLMHFISALHEFQTGHSAHILVHHLDNLIIAAKGKVCTTKLTTSTAQQGTVFAAHAAVWWLQNPSQPYQALCSSIID